MWIFGLNDLNDISLNDQELDVFLTKYFSYYRTLSQHWKSVFVERVIKFANSKWFVSQKGFEINNQVKAIISASAVQLTLGLENWRIGYFDTIILFSSDFKNEISGLKLKGETNLNGFVSFSWKRFIDGYKIPNDNLNLGLHEFTHALRFNGVRGHESDDFFDGYFPKWFSYANEEFKQLKSGGKSIFRKYGGTNINEFLSVVVEHFFESPTEFQRELPLFYSATALMLNQKTNRTETKVNIREEEIRIQGRDLKLSPTVIRRGLPLFAPAFICLAISLFTAYVAGVFSFPALFTFIVFVLAFFREDFLYRSFTIEGNELLLSKGFFLFKHHAFQNISLPQLVKIEFFNGEGNDHSVSLTFFETDGSFYEETAYVKLEEGDRNQFLKELQDAYVWVK